jgi:hypothetical protein
MFNENWWNINPLSSFCNSQGVSRLKLKAAALNPSAASKFLKATQSSLLVSSIACLSLAPGRAIANYLSQPTRECLEIQHTSR